PDLLAADVGVGAFGDVDQVSVVFVDRVALGFHIHPGGVVLDDVGEDSAVAAEWVGDEFVAETVAGEGDGAAGVFLFDVAVEVGGVADLGFDFFFAVAVV